jgi:hypothetical protein
MSVASRGVVKAKKVFSGFQFLSVGRNRRRNCSQEARGLNLNLGRTDAMK